MTRQQMKLEAKQALKGNLGVAIGIYIVYGIIVAALSSIGVGGFFVGLFTYGIMVAFLNMTRKDKLEFTDLFSGFNNFGTVFGATILKAIYTALWTLLLFIPGLVKSYSYAMTEYILADEPWLKCNEAITKSRKMMHGHKMELFILELSFIGWILLCALTLGILTFYVTPYMLTTRAKFYENLKANYVEE